MLTDNYDGEDQEGKYLYAKNRQVVEG